MELIERRCISFKCKKSFWFVFFYWIFELGYRLFSYFEWDFIQIVENDADNEYLYIIFLNLADLLSFFEMPCHNQCRNLCSDVKDNPVNRCDIKTVVKLFVIFLLDLLSRSTYFIFHKIFDIDNEEVSQKFAHDIIIVFDIFFRFLFYVCLFKGEPHKHKICSIISMIIIFISLISLDVVNINYQKTFNDWSKNLYFISILGLRAIIFPLVDTIVKKIMVDNYVFPFQYMRYRGSIQFLYLIIMTTILYLTSNLNFSIDIFSRKLAISAPLYIVSCFIKAILLLIVIYNFSSQSVSFLIISESFAGSIKEIIDFFNKDKNKTSIAISIIEMILVILIGIATMIYEEIIVIRLCGLEKDVREEISNRASLDHGSAENLLGDNSYFPIEPQTIN